MIFRVYDRSPIAPVINYFTGYKEGLKDEKIYNDMYAVSFDYDDSIRLQ